jgi:hypothetical protein
MGKYWLSFKRFILKVEKDLALSLYPQLLLMVLNANSVKTTAVFLMASMVTAASGKTKVADL